eukprot:CAMPEP_0171301716 /NCGR_PEP_ID=MMETSP0816-20121228/10935_1 /TAXON_ID=420281 /ORGANISM="Proboscia inermis, Strain CCAP1064/1" /LENGTH=126 /DNA_ID=CAMNT_0011779517 /DNA_START=116 /DNA_END=498 /DNA_ORIENTATION=-
MQRKLYSNKADVDNVIELLQTFAFSSCGRNLSLAIVPRLDPRNTHVKHQRGIAGPKRLLVPLLPNLRRRLWQNARIPRREDHPDGTSMRLVDPSRMPIMPSSAPLGKSPLPTFHDNSSKSLLPRLE